jgi:hypothetical protein
MRVAYSFPEVHELVAKRWYLRPWSSLDRIHPVFDFLVTHTKPQLLTLWNHRVAVSQSFSCLDGLLPSGYNMARELLDKKLTLDYLT